MNCWTPSRCQEGKKHPLMCHLPSEPFSKNSQEKIGHQLTERPALATGHSQRVEPRLRRAQPPLSGRAGRPGGRVLMGRAVSLQRGFRQAGRGGRAALEAGSPGNGGFIHCTHHLQTPAYMYHRPQTHTIERAIKMHMMYAHSYIRSHIHSPVSPATCTLCSTHPYMYTTYTYHRIQRTCLCANTHKQPDTHTIYTCVQTYSRNACAMCTQYIPTCVKARV